MTPPPNASEASDLPPRLTHPLARCARGELPPNVALMQLLTEAADPGEAERALRRVLAGAEAREAERLEQMMAIWRANPQAFATVKGVLRHAEHHMPGDGPVDPVAHWAAVFDAVARTSPEGGVALYSLGSPELLRAATEEVVARMREWGLLGRGRALLEIGCGNGRFQEALSPEVGLVVGLDISSEMVEAARRRCAGLANVAFHQTSGHDLSRFEDGSFDLVFAVDCFPYLTASGMTLAGHHIREAARVLKTTGDLLILNFSYRGDLDADRRDLARLAGEAGLLLRRNGTRDFALWDGAAFLLARPG